jgi:hypothetical protein
MAWYGVFSPTYSCALALSMARSGLPAVSAGAACAIDASAATAANAAAALRLPTRSTSCRRMNEFPL